MKMLSLTAPKMVNAFDQNQSGLVSDCGYYAYRRAEARLAQ
jgi:hypothetical protein